MTYPTARVTCPVCAAEIIAVIDPGEEPVYYPNDRAHPGAPACLVETEGCECMDSIVGFVRLGSGAVRIPGEEWYEEEVLRRADEEKENGN